MSEPTRVAVNGFGRVGRSVFRAAVDDPDVALVGVNDVMEDDDLAYLARHDTVMGRREDAAVEDGHLVAGDTRARVTHERDPAALPWAELDVDVALECTGAFRTHGAASGHLDAGADRAVISAPPKDEETLQVVYGVNHEAYDGERVVSNASCTTNSVAPVAATLHDAFGLRSGHLTTVHAYTGTQSLVDEPRAKRRRGRAAAANVVPTTTGAADAVTEVLPALSGRLDGRAIRVPVPNGSVTELVVDLEGSPGADEINDRLRAAADGPLAGVLGYTDEEIVSSDVLGLPYSSFADLSATAAVGDGDLASVLAWYDNEFGFACRLLDLAAYVAP